jgi:pimeloyl-ACP methyl ester carboxylesterase
MSCQLSVLSCQSSQNANACGGLSDNRRPTTVNCFDTGRYRCRYAIWGQGAPLVFVHGLGELSISFLPLISILSTNLRCVAYELPSGHGDGADLQHYRHADIVNDLFALLDHLELAQCYLYGNSFGSTIALAAAATRPLRIARLIVQGGFAHRPLAPAERLLGRLARHLIGTMADLPFFRDLFRLQITGGVGGRSQGSGVGGQNALPHQTPDPSPLTPALWDFFLDSVGRASLSAMAYRALLVDQLDLRPALAQIRQPTLVLRGDCDAVVGNPCRDDLMAGLPAARCIELPECGHYGHMTHFEVIAELVRQFLTPPAPMKDEQ